MALTKGPFLASLQLTVRSISRRSMSCVCNTEKSPTIGVSRIFCRLCSRSEDGLSQRKRLMILLSARCARGSMSKRSIYTKKLLAVFCVMASTICLAQSPGARILVLEREQGEKRIRRPREKVPGPTSEFILKVTPQNSGSQHLVFGTETIPPGGVIPKHRHLGPEER